MNKKNANILFFIILLFCFIAPGNYVLAEQIIEHHDPGFSISIPDDFKALPSKLMPESWLYGFKERTGIRDEPQITIGVEKVENVIKDTDQRLAILKKRFSSAGSSVEEMVFDVSGVEFKGIRVINCVGKVKSIMLIVQLPADGQLVRIIAGGDMEREGEIYQLFKDTLMSFRAKDSLFGRFSKLILVIIFVFTIILLINRFIYKGK